MPYFADCMIRIGENAYRWEFKDGNDEDGD
jgi:hypothetical protein